MMQGSTNETVLETAGLFGRRFLALCLDILILIGLLIVIPTTMYDTSSSFFPLIFINWLRDLLPFHLSFLLLFTSAFIGPLTIAGIYFIACWAIFGQTPGMMVMRIKLIQKNGTKSGILRVFIRFLTGPLLFALVGIEIMLQIWTSVLRDSLDLGHLGGLILGIFVIFIIGSLLGGFLGFFSQLVRPSRRAFYDWASGTYVVVAPPFRLHLGSKKGSAL